MKSISSIFLTSLLSQLLAVMQACSQTTGPTVFVATTPCSSGSRPVPGIPKEAECELIKWELKLFKGNSEQSPGTYILDCSYGLSRQGTKELKNGGKHLHREGKWIIINGNKEKPAAVIYRLDPDTPRVSISFLKLNEHLIHLLDSQQRLMIGNGAGGYSLSSIKQ